MQRVSGCCKYTSSACMATVTAFRVDRRPLRPQGMFVRTGVFNGRVLWAGREPHASSPRKGHSGLPSRSSVLSQNIRSGYGGWRRRGGGIGELPRRHQPRDVKCVPTVKTVFYVGVIGLGPRLLLND